MNIALDQRRTLKQIDAIFDAINDSVCFDADSFLRVFDRMHCLSEAGKHLTASLLTDLPPDDDDCRLASK